MARIIQAQSKHTLYVEKIEEQNLPLPDLENAKQFSEFWAVRNFDKNGYTFFYIGKGHKEAPKQLVVWYRSGKMWAGFGKTFKEAIDGAQKDGWLYA